MVCIAGRIAQITGYYFSSLTVVTLTITAVERWLHMSRKSLLTVRRVVTLYATFALILIVFFASVLGSCVFCAPLDRHIGRHIDRQSTDVSADISAECRPICQPICRSSVDRYVDRDVSLDISADISVEHRSICRLTLDRYVGRYVDREWLSDCRPTC